MSVQDRKLAGIRAAKEKLAINRQYGGGADPRVRKGSVAPSVEGEKVDGKGEGKTGVKKEKGTVGKKGEVNGVA